MTLRYLAYGALFLIPFIPLYVADNLFFPFITGKGFAFRILVEIAVGAWVALAIADKRYRPQFSWTLLIYGVFVAWMFIADVLAPNAHKALWSNYERMDGWITLIHVFLFFVVAGSVLSVGRLWKRWWLTFLGASALISLYGLLQLSGALQIHQGGVRLDATFGNAAYLAAYLLTTIAVALWHAMESKGWLRYTLFALAAVQTMLLFATATRGAILAFVGAAVLVGVLFSLSTKKTRKAGAIALGGIVLAIGGFLLLKDTSFVQNDPTLTRIANISTADGMTRFALWDMAWKGALERPITGWGQEGFNYVFAKHYEPAFYLQEPWFDRAHSVYFDWLTAGGFPALLLYLALLISAVVGLWRSKASLPERILLTAAFAAYAFQALFVFDNLMTYVVLAALLAMAHSETARPFARLEKLQEVHGPVVVGVVATVTVVALWSINVPGIVGAGKMIEGFKSSDPAQTHAQFVAAGESGSFATQEISEQFVVMAATVARRAEVSTEIKQLFFTSALTQMEKEIARVPADPRLRIQLATGLEQAGLRSEALREMDEAIVLSPRKQTTYLQRALIHVRAGEFAAALADFTTAHELDPSFEEPVIYLASGYVFAGTPVAARAVLQERLGTTTVDHDLYRAALYEKGLYTELVASAEKRLRTLPNDPNAHMLLAQSYALAGRIVDARTVLQNAITRFPQAATSATQLLNALTN